MKRLYYVTDSVNSVVSINEDLGRAGIGDNRVHVMGRDAAPLERAQVHTTTPWEETEIMPLGFMGAILGLTLGLLAGFGLAGLDPWGMDLGGEIIIACAAFFTCFGAWLGGILGISSRNHHIAPYMDQVEKGHYLVMVDADDEQQERQVRQVMERQHREANQAGYEDHFSPLF
jgi:hypothetical protein